MTYSKNLSVDSTVRLNQVASQELYVAASLDAVKSECR